LSDPGIKKRVDRGVAWVGVATTLVSLCDVLALALILHFWVDAASFGVVSVVVTVFPALLLASDLGLPSAVIQGEEPDDTRKSTVFWIALTSGISFYALVFVASPLVADAQGHAVITDLFRVAGLQLLLRPLYTTHRALLRRELRFKELSVVRVIANFVEFGVKIAIAASGYGIWAFAIAPLGRELTYAIGLPIVLRWRPRLVCRLATAGNDIRFGLRQTGSEILQQVYGSIHYQVVSAYFGAAAVGAYRAAFELVIEPVRIVSEVITVVAFPAFAKQRHDRAAVIEQFVAFTRQNLIIVLTVVALIVVAAGDLLTVIVGPRYAGAADAARILAVVGVFRAMSHLGPPLLDGLGRPDLTLRFQAIATAFLTACFVAFGALLHGAGPLSIAIAWAVAYPVVFVYLFALVFGQLQLGAGDYLRAIRRVFTLVGLAALAGGAIHVALLDAVGPGVRLGITAVVVIGTSLGLLGWSGDFSPRVIVRLLRAR
jgi:PST family polysaccharide transporter